MSTLYELTGQYKELMEMAEEGCFDQQTINDTLEGVEGEIEIKADNYAKMIRSLEGEAQIINDEVDRLEKRKKILQTNIASLKQNLETAMRETGKTKFKTDLFNFGIQKNKPSVKITDESKLPEEFWVFHEPTVDKTAALEFLKENGEQDWGMMIQTESLRIR